MFYIFLLKLFHWALPELYKDIMGNIYKQREVEDWRIRNQHNFTTLNICMCETTPKADSAGDMRLIDFNARINAFIVAFDEIPVSVSINEAVEISKKYATNEDASFVNGILSTVAKSL